MGVSAAVEVSIAARPDRRRDATSHPLETRPSPCSTDSPSARSPPPFCNTVVPTPGHRPRHAPIMATDSRQVPRESLSATRLRFVCRLFRLQLEGPFVIRVRRTAPDRFVHTAALKPRPSFPTPSCPPSIPQPLPQCLFFRLRFTFLLRPYARCNGALRYQVQYLCAQNHVHMVLPDTHNTVTVTS